MMDGDTFLKFQFELYGPIQRLLNFLQSFPSISIPQHLLHPLHTLVQWNRSNEKGEEINKELKASVLNALSELLLYPELTLEIIALFRPCIIDLSARLVHSIQQEIGLSRSPTFSYNKRKLNAIESEYSSNLSKNNEPISHMEVDSTECMSSNVNEETFFLTFHERRCIAFSKIVLVAPQIIPLLSYYFSTHPSPLDRILTLNETSCFYVSNLNELLLATYRLVSAMDSLKKQFPLHSLIPRLHEASFMKEPWTSKLLAHVLMLTYSLSDYDTSLFLEKFITQPFSSNPSSLAHPASVQAKTSEKETKVHNIDDFFILEHREFVRSLQQRMFDPPLTIESQNQVWMDSNDLSPFVENVCGILIPKHLPISTSLNSTSSSTTLLDTPTTLKNLQSLAMAVSLGSPVLLEGVPGAGKTTLIEELARRLNLPSHCVIKIHLGDQVDGKSLLGSYVATHQPGEFLWSCGVLTRAVQEGQWVILEDLDMVSQEIVSILIPLLETRTLFISQRGQKITAHPQFQLFATCSLDPYTLAPKPMKSSSLTLSLWSRVRIHPLPQTELIPILGHLFPCLNEIALTLVQLFEHLQSLFRDPMYRTSAGYAIRFISTRDLMKWCHRLHTLVAKEQHSLTSDLLHTNPDIVEAIFLEAMDVFTSLVPMCELKEKTLALLQTTLNIPQDRLEFYTSYYAPKIQTTSTVVTCGRITFPIPKPLLVPPSSQLFTYTGHTKRLLEQVSVCTYLNEPALLIGETGTGKTSLIQHLASLLQKKIHVINLSQQSDSSDLLGGFKPMSMTSHLEQLIDTFLNLFASTFSVKKNTDFLKLVQTARERKKTEALVSLFQQAIQLANERCRKKEASKSIPMLDEKAMAWKEFGSQVDQFVQLTKLDKKNIFFKYVEGVLVSALCQGDWILLDEVNLATAETLESLSGLLEKQGSILLSERGDETSISKHPEFRLFACMNPSTDIGKKDLPMGLRNRFTELYVSPPDANLCDLKLITASYLSNCLHTDPRIFQDVVEFYTQAKALALTQLYDGAGFRPHFTLRTLTRALTFASSTVSMFGVRRALFEGISLTFMTLLDLPSQTLLASLIHKCFFHDRVAQYLNASVTPPPNSEAYVRFDSYWLKKGPFEHTCSTTSLTPNKPYILSPTVRKNLIHLARSVMTQKYPVLIQGPTSSGKTSMVEYLAKITGHRFVRVNNHAHTDLQEYLGCYVSNDQGQLVFKEGTLVTALREGHWIVLDELNLAPTDVLEALNRLLDENRELFIPETQQWVRPHPHFMLFATQNPPSYGGRKLLSRAFRNRFLELHFDDLPEDELLQILSQRCAIAPSYAKKMLQVYKELRKRRQESRIFDGKASFITLRDLFRWADRSPSSYEELGMHGYMILGERVRNNDEKQQILDVLQEVLRLKLDPQHYYSNIYHAHAETLPRDIVWNASMQRLFALSYICQLHREPVLLVGETGCGKTTVCQILSSLYQKPLTMVNCHQYSETSDFIGSQRPCRHSSQKDKLFEWQDGPLVLAMKQGGFFLLDEISLADDSVLERLNSLLEPSRTLLLAEKGGEAEHVLAHPEFRFFATMNPGGDYGKKELSPALRNRFTELWTPPITSYEDRLSILQARLQDSVLSSDLASRILDFIVWYEQECERRHVPALVSIRDLISWSSFITASHPLLSESESLYHGACLVLLDGLKNKPFREECVLKLQNRTQCSSNPSPSMLLHDTESHFGIEPFLIAKGPHPCGSPKHSFDAPTAKQNLYRLLRALFTTSKAILLEGSPGVGKTSIVSSLADLSGHRLIRINLSEQTDLVDLFGSDLPIEGGEAAAFAWRDGLFLSAMKNGDWVLLDELNLASQSVLEGLNACLDHRGAVYIPELNKSFEKHPEFRIFGAQNPMDEGGGRRGLPKSFLNRFTVIHFEPLTHSDYSMILNSLFPRVVTEDELSSMIQFNALMHRKTMVERDFGVVGSPWEFNLRDLIRWLELKSKYPSYPISTFLDLIYFHRLQTEQDVEKATALWLQVTSETSIYRPALSLLVTPQSVELGLVNYPRCNTESHLLPFKEVTVPHSLLRPLHTLLKCLDIGWMVMLNGPSASGKTHLARTAASLCGRTLVEFSLHKSVDAMELLGGFEQMDANRCWEQLISRLTNDTIAVFPFLLKSGALPKETQILASYTCSTFPLNTPGVDVWITQLHEVTQYLSLPDHHATHLQLWKHFQSAAEQVAGKFEWVDGIILEAIQTGKWLLLENANICSPSVLDRLNPLFESVLNRKELVINERGMSGSGEFVVVEPHPEFRLIMTMNSMHGQISRALRNRGIEICLFENQWVKDTEILRQVMESKGILDPLTQVQFLSKLNAQQYAPREMVSLISYAADLIQRGFSKDQIMKHELLFSNSLCSPIEAHSQPSFSMVPLSAPIQLQHSLPTLLATKFSFVESNSSLCLKFLQPALDWILISPSTFTFYNSILAWLKWRSNRCPPTLFSLDALKQISEKHHAFLNTELSNMPLLVKCFLQYTKFLLPQEEVFSHASSLSTSSMNIIQRSFTFHSFPERIVVPVLNSTEKSLYPLFKLFNHCILTCLEEGLDSRTLDILTWTESMWRKCCLESTLDLDLLDAHLSQLLKLTERSPIFLSYRKALLSLQASYSGDRDITRLMWFHFHPWIVRSFALCAPASQLESLFPSRIPSHLIELISDALFNMYLGDIDHQALLEQDFPRLLSLVNANSSISLDTNDSSAMAFRPRSLHVLKKKLNILNKKHTKKSNDWIWAMQMFDVLAKSRDQLTLELPSYLSSSSLLYSCSPSIKALVLMKLLNWSLQHNKFVERSWNQGYFEYQKIAIKNSLWEVYPKKLSRKLFQRSQSETILGLGSLKTQVSNVISLLIEHHDMLEADLSVKERSLLKTRRNLLLGLPISLESKEHELQLDRLMQCNSLYDLSEAWIHLGLLFIKLAIPVSPLDPASRFKLSYENALEFQTKLSQELEAFKLLQFRDNGSNENPIIIWLNEKLPEIKNLILESGRQLYLRPENASSHLRVLFSDLRGLFSALFEPKTFLEPFKSATFNSGLRDRLDVIRQSFLSFVAKTKEHFPLFIDLLEPIYTGIFDILHGFNLLCVPQLKREKSFVEKTLEHLPWLPPNTLSHILETLPNLNSHEAVKLSTHLLETIAHYQHSNPHFEIKPSILLRLLHPFIVEFTSIKEDEQLERLESMRSFKYSTTFLEIRDEESDTEWFNDKDKSHLAKLEQSEIDIEAEESPLTTSQNPLSAATETNKNITKSEKKQFFSWMTRAFFAFLQMEGHLKWDIFTKEAMKWSYTPTASSPTLSHLLSLFRAYESFSKEVNPLTYDFYRDSNLPEVLRLNPILTKLDIQLHSLLKEWPEHDILHQIMGIVHRLCEFPAHLPLKKFLESVEFLITRCDEWEKYAASHVSLKECIQDLSSIIVDWRRLEVSNWRILLEWYDREQTKDCAVLWLHLLSTLTFAEDIPETELVAILDEFLLGSPLGQFSLRIQILSSLSKYFSIPIVINVIQYYSEFLTFVQATLSSRRAVIETEIKDFVKIAGWRDINIYSLKLSAQKTHKHLGKCLKKYRELLGQPLAPMLKEKNIIYFGEQRTKSTPKGPVASTCAVDSYKEKVLALLNSCHREWSLTRDSQMNRIVTKSSNLISTFVSLPDILEELAQDVIQQIVLLKTETDAISKAITKQESTFLLQCRKKALSDFLKKFKEMGLLWHHSVTPELSTLMTSPAIQSDSLFSFDSLLKSANTYFFRVSSFLPFVITDRSQDLQPKQTERLLGYIMDLYKHTILERNHLGPVCSHLSELQKAICSWTLLGAEPLSHDHWTSSCSFSFMMVDLTSLLAYMNQLFNLNVLSISVKKHLENVYSKVLECLKSFKESLPLHESIMNLNHPLLRAWEEKRDYLFKDIQAFLETSPRDKVFLQPILETISKSIEVDSNSLEEHLNVSFFDSIDHFIENIMIQIQHLYAFNSMESSVTFKSLYSNVISMLSKLDTNFIHKFSESCLKNISPILQYHIRKRLLPLIKNYSEYLSATLHEVFIHHKSLAKCTYILCTNAFKLIERGFCVPTPPDSEDSDTGDADGELEAADGTGIGQGEGQKDVSNEMDNEGQVEGLRGEEQYNPELPKENKKDEGIEMDQDFEGNLEDLNLDDREKDVNNDEDMNSEFESEDDEKMDMMNQVDKPESHKVDPTLWDEESEDEKEMREAEDVNKADVERDPHEVESLDETQNLQKESKSKQNAKDENMEGHLDNASKDEEKNEDKNTDMEAEDKEKTSNEKQNDEDGNIDMEASLSDTEEEKKKSGEATSDSKHEENIDLEGLEGNPLDLEEGMLDDQNGLEDLSQGEDSDVQNDTSEEAGVEELDKNEKEGEESPMDVDNSPDMAAKDTQMNEDVYGNDDHDVNGHDFASEETDEQKKEPETEMSPTIAGHSNKSEGQDDAIDETMEIAQHEGPSQKQINSSKNFDSNMQTPQQEDIAKPSDITPSLADNIEAWKRRLKMVERHYLSEHQTDSNKDKMNNDQSPQEYTHLQDDDQELSGDEQMLSAADPDQTRDLPFPLNEEKDDKDSNLQSNLPNYVGPMIQEPLMQTTTTPQDILAPEDEIKVQFFSNVTSQQTPLLLDEEKEFRKKMLEEVDSWREKGRDLSSSIALWHGCKNLTLPYATQLTEQLRLLLEPSLASHLTGDYKTGKRLNMRRVLSYIASDFRKDKIWLRRTKPNQRNYQVLIAVDDSQSMNDSCSIQLAFESVCLITRSMEQLEVGPIAVCSFGEDVKVVHSFGHRFTDEAGVRAFQSFQFSQTRTNIEALLTSALHLFEETPSQHTPWRLMLILSDGLCDHHNKLRHLVRKAAEARILTVCIVLDQREESILKMSTVNFEHGQLRMAQYMDDFPFDFYVVLRDIRRLPMVLSDALRQFFTLSTST